MKLLVPREPFVCSLHAPKAFGGRALSGPAGGAHSAPPDTLAGFEGATSRRGRGAGGDKERDGREC
jgi:hypothetical protein